MKAILSMEIKQAILQKHTRKIVQFIFLLLTVWIGIKFIGFVHQLETGAEVTIQRPPGVEAFLPIASLMSLKYWLVTGIFNTIHPSGLVILLVILATALLLKKGFCSWVCPIGLLSDYSARLHTFIFGRSLKVWKWLDYPLRSLKYLLLFFFLWAILVQMNAVDLGTFIYSPYNKVSDIKMLKFFSEMSMLTARVLAVLLLMSIAIRYFWCRYLCPYGALLGAVSWLSVFKIRRNAESCIDCEKCTKVCPANIIVHKAGSVLSDECHACFSCVDACPVKDTLYLSTSRPSLKMPKAVYGLFIVGLFLFATSIARVLGYWHNSIGTDEYKYHVRHIDEPLYQHNRGQVPQYGTGMEQHIK